MRIKIKFCKFSFKFKIEVGSGFDSPDLEAKKPALVYDYKDFFFLGLNLEIRTNEKEFKKE